ncbi:MAG: metallophosphoesterase family protein [Planctomycetes bacterium]|nr:metallophosphoesterase family protein [Planctomycetota bacterium]
MKLGVLADTHDRLERTQRAVDILIAAGANTLIHCGDLTGWDIVEACSVLPFCFVFGNHDADTVPDLRQAADDFGATCLEWGGEVTLSGSRIAIVHGHLTSDLRPLLESSPEFLFSGHSHEARDWQNGPTRRVNPGAIHRAREFSVALVDLATAKVRFLPVPRQAALPPNSARR